MNKICKIHGVITDVAPDEMRCPECGELLVDSVGQELLSTPTGMSQDNRLHYGDSFGKQVNGNEVNAGGDVATTIDKSSTTTVNNNTTTYVEYPKDEGMNVVECAFSGEKVRVIDTFRCRICNRVGKKEFLVPQHRCCEDCAKAIQAQAQHSQPMPAPAFANPVYSASQAPQRAIESQVASTPPPPSVEQESGPKPYGHTRVPMPGVVTPPKSSGGNKSKWVVAGVVAAVTLALVFILMPGKKNTDISDVAGTEELAAVDSPAGQQDPISSVTQSSGQNNGNSVVDTRSEATTHTTPQSTTQPSSQPDPPPASPFDEGVAAYKSGNYAGAKVFLQSAASEGNATAAYYLGDIFSTGKGGNRDLKKGFSFMKQAAEGGCVMAYFPLAEMYRNGDGTEANRSMARRWYEKTVISDKAHSAQAAEYLSLFE